MNFKEFYLLTEMPHFSINGHDYDLKLEQHKNVFEKVIAIFRKYKKEDIVALFKQTPFIMLLLKKEFRKIPNREEIYNKLEKYGLKYLEGYLW